MPTLEGRTSLHVNYNRDAWRYDVLLDGEFLNNCIAADENAGRATVLKRDATGRLTLPIDCEVVYGRVEIRHSSLRLREGDSPKQTTTDWGIQCCIDK